MIDDTSQIGAVPPGTGSHRAVPRWMAYRAQARSNDDRIERERLHFNQIVRQQFFDDLVMAPENLSRYRNPPANTPFPLEYAFHLAGNLSGRHVIEIGCGDGLNTVMLAALGAKVTAIDISNESLSLSRRRAEANGVANSISFVRADAANLADMPDSSTDVVFAISVMHHVDIESASQEIHRLLRPGGRAVFMEPPAGHRIWRTIKVALPRAPEVTEDEQPLIPEQILKITGTVGVAGPARCFGFSYRLVHRFGVKRWSVVRRSHLVDAWLLNRIASLREFASPLVWCADKPLMWGDRPGNHGGFT